MRRGEVSGLEQVSLESGIEKWQSSNFGDPGGERVPELGGRATEGPGDGGGGGGEVER